ncbi:MAG: hypothetical protein ACPHRA_01255 [Limisphaerales bacterium]
MELRSVSLNPSDLSAAFDVQNWIGTLRRCVLEGCFSIEVKDF